MRYFLLFVGLLSFKLIAAETIQNDACASQDCDTQTPKAMPADKAATPSDSADNSTATKTSAVKSGMESTDKNEPLVLKPHRAIMINVVGQGVAPTDTSSPAQAYALAKRAAIADAYRLIAEKVKGVEVEGQDLIKNMMVKRSTVRTAVYAMVRHANIVETNFRDGLCEVEMEIKLSYDSLPQ